MQLSSAKTNSDRGGKAHVTRNTSPKSVIGSRTGVCVMVDGDDGRTYRLCLEASDLRLIAEEMTEVLAA